jgi:CHAD domain-containing protein
LVSYVLGPELTPQDVLGALEQRFLLEPLGHSHESLAYLDTFDWRLFRRGLALTTRARRGKVALTLDGTPAGRVSLLAPHPPDFAEELPPSPLADALAGAAGIRRLLPQVRVRARSRSWAILNEDGKTVVRLALREGEALLTQGPFPGSAATARKGTALPPFLHLSPLKGYPAELGRVVLHLKQVLGLRPASLGELTLALEAVGRVPCAYTSSFRLRLDPSSRADLATRAILQELLATLVANEQGVVLDLDSEFLHDFRVAVRRTRSALGQIKGVLPVEPTSWFREEFRWLGACTGPARDIDVYLLKIPEYRAALPGEASEALEPLVRFLRARKRREHRALVRALGSRRCVRLMERWSRFLEGEAGEGPQGDRAARPIRWVASERIWKAFGRVLALGAAITPQSPAGELHRLRIECKKLRYLLTFFQSLYPPEALAPPAEELKRLQDNLGDFNDLNVQIQALRGFAGEMMRRRLAPPETFLAMGRLVGQLETRQLLERKAFGRRFRAFARAKNRKHFQALFGGDAGSR